LAVVGAHSFGINVIARTGISGSNITAAVAADGTIFASNSNYIYRFLANGNLDTATTANGFTNGQRDADGIYVQSLTVDSTGRLLAGGSRWQSTSGVYSYDFAVARLSLERRFR
jgi:hypothetical protein